MINNKEEGAKRFSIWGLLIGSIFIIWAVWDYIKGGHPQFITPYSGFYFLMPGLAIFIRSLRQPMGWKKGLITFFGGLFVGISIVTVLNAFHDSGMPDGVVFMQVFISLIFIFIAIPMLISGFKDPKSANGNSSSKLPG